VRSAWPGDLNGGPKFLGGTAARKMPLRFPATSKAPQHDAMPVNTPDG